MQYSFIYLIFILHICFSACASTGKSSLSSTTSSSKKSSTRSSSSSSASSTSSSNSTRGIEYVALGVGKNLQGRYYVNASVGEPQQEQSLVLDTTEPYLWVISGNVEMNCTDTNNVCNANSLYYYNESSSAVAIDENADYQMDFLNYVSFAGSSYMDTINFTDISIKNNYTNTLLQSNLSAYVNLTNDHLWVKNVSFLDSTTATSLYSGVLGLGGSITSSNEYENSGNYDSSYFIFNKFKEANITQSNSYSLWLVEDESSLTTTSTKFEEEGTFGKLLLGVIDPALYRGSLYQFDMIPYVDPESLVSSQGYPILPMGVIYVKSESGARLNVTSKDFLEPVLLDSSQQGNYLPENAIIQIAIQIGATYIESMDRWLVSCDMASYGASVLFTFDGLEIDVPLENLLTNTFETGSNSSIYYSDGETACALTIYDNANMGYNLLGSAFFRNTYIAVDLEGNTVAIAQAKPSDEDDSSNLSATTLPAAAIKSHFIPYAYYRNLTNYSTMSLVPSSVTNDDSTIPYQLSASVFSNGIVTAQQRSFFDTTRSSTTKSSSTEFNNIEGSTSNQANHIKPFAAPQHHDHQQGLFAVCILYLLGLII
ncbi:hypothetical protein KAFR_0E04080 [Kazachstania africana CBS 2517]|uniref:Peptidase A1 domain-containing protein n=1 Tax=Kazachstania africana (strain ATCC 22294 / BCRC 22015 / CBS 2517 / CECT 1963 / NBRC 1671 / NRRL Y-8276) TaxID=1071382 RepID=H2AW09_KAZAF|nr:hypothetical protein KAFR_0E04080 [Kazachstania africana CBS 2517]CCF58559.1 hypothetical protein KAFR_0E04080 [Kazachstania africana CBS 2517]